MTDSSERTSYLEFPSASLFRRLASMVYDLLILVAMWLLIGFAHAAIRGVDNLENNDSLQYTLFPFLLGGTFLFYYWFWSRGGQTLGMRAWRLQVVDANLDGRPLRLAQCLSRFLIAILSLLSFGLGYIWVLVSPSGDSWHDSLSNTRTLVLPTEENKKVMPARRRR
ncbi:RDD family protein [Ketobacter sp. MCCC 1A13808]|uniref:RDD family protein n=1 Tax=Ketobacter sp. MCCC 1A13808 TaxID=2602738 RepID=UPI000F256325|nr:RDD family protein [Ketobacter sp. MCCC 1A13808]MVF14560.1 RDD family protein [Ketobacter sp. MCCC 1A13808]RLP54170.1 MAG: RDD family protein [Ketobacter sp.]